MWNRCGDLNSEVNSLKLSEPEIPEESQIITRERKERRQTKDNFNDQSEEAKTFIGGLLTKN